MTTDHSLGKGVYYAIDDYGGFIREGAPGPGAVSRAGLTARPNGDWTAGPGTKLI